MGNVGINGLGKGLRLLYAIADAVEQQDIPRAKELNVQVTDTGLYKKSGEFRKIQSALLSYHPDVEVCQNGYLSEWRPRIDAMFDE